MADTYNMTEVAKIQATTPRDMVDSRHAHGRVRCWCDQLTTVEATHVSGDTIRVAKVPKGAVVLHIVTWASANISATNNGTLTWGYAPVDSANGTGSRSNAHQPRRAVIRQKSRRLLR